MKVEVVVVDPVFHIELTPDEAWHFKVLLEVLDEERIASALSGCRWVVDSKDVTKTVKELYNALPGESSNVPYASKDILFQSEATVK